MASVPLTVDHLPSEILIQVLSTLQTRQLLPLARINRRFHDLTLRIIHNRLACVASLPDHELILECYHPSGKLSTPYLNCDYLGTDGLQQGVENQLSFSQLRNVYSRYRPVVQEENRSPRRRYSTAHPTSTAPEEPQPATHEVHLDDGEMFSQLCTVTNLVKVGPKRGLFLSHVNVSDGVVRVFRRWLAAAAARTAGNGTTTGADDGEQLLWTDRTKNVGLRFRVRENVDDARRPILVDADEDLPVSYTLEYQELLVRTNQLILNVENAEDQEVTNTDSSGFILEHGTKLPCQAQTLLWMQPPPDMFQRQWGQPAASIWVGGA